MNPFMTVFWTLNFPLPKKTWASYKIPSTRGPWSDRPLSKVKTYHDICLDLSFPHLWRGWIWFRMRFDLSDELWAPVFILISLLFFFSFLFIFVSWKIYLNVYSLFFYSSSCCSSFFFLFFFFNLFCLTERSFGLFKSFFQVTIL